MFRTMVLSAAGAALVVCLVVSVLQFVTTVPMILYAEQFEEAAAGGHDDGAAAEEATAHVHDEAAWSPAEGFERAAYTGLANLVVGFAGGPIPALPVNLALLKGSALIGVDYRQFGSVFEAPAAVAIRDRLFDAVARGDLTPPLGTGFSFEDFAQAMDLAASRDGLGKTIVILVDSS